jgi:hypothetical protein
MALAHTGRKPGVLVDRQFASARMREMRRRCTGGAKAEAYEGCLVQVEGATVTAPVEQFVKGRARR